MAPTIPVRVLVVASIGVVGAITPAAAQTPAPAAASAPSARVVLRLDSGTTARFSARAFELHVGQNGAAAGDASIQLVKAAGPATGDLVRLTGTAATIPDALIEIYDSLTTPVMTLRLTNVTVVSDQVALSDARTGLEQQRILQQESLSQLTSDFQEAQRQLETLEELGKTRVATRQDIARARDRASDLRQRIDLLKQRQALLGRRLATTSAVEETLVLHFERLEMEDAATGVRSTLQLSSKGSGRPRS